MKLIYFTAALAILLLVLCIIWVGDGENRKTGKLPPGLLDTASMELIDSLHSELMPCNLRDYQITVYMDTLWLYDGERLVGRYTTKWDSKIDSLIEKDNPGNYTINK